MFSKQELIEKMSAAINDSHPYHANPWDEIIRLSQKDGYMIAKGILRNTRKQAEAALQALLSSLPDQRTPECSDESSEYYKQLLAMRGK